MKNPKTHKHSSIHYFFRHSFNRNISKTELARGRTLFSIRSIIALGGYAENLNLE